jgi:hypothetical protein
VAFLGKMQSPASSPTHFVTGVPQALTLLNGSEIAEATDLARSGLLASLEAPFFNNDECIEVLFLATLSRYPTDAERERVKQHLDATSSGNAPHKALTDILWALLNCAEFGLNH